jgi:acetate kinase
MAAEILILNAGSSSIKVSLFASDGGGLVRIMSGQVEGIGTPHPHATARTAAGESVLDQTWEGGGGPADHGRAVAFVVERLTQRRPGWAPAGVGHRVVHGGTRFFGPVAIDPAVRADLEALVPLAPLHQPANLAGIDAIAAAFPGARQVACFDTAFHHGRSFASEAFALPRDYYDRGIRRYGFHGLSFEYIARAMRTVAPAAAAGRLIVAHLGNGASLCALRAGRSVETTMGFSTAEGLPMGTRCGQIDPGVILDLFDRQKLAAADVGDLLYTRSGLLGLSGVGSDMRDLLASADPRARDAVDYFVYRVTWYVGALTAALGGLDGLVFTAGIGEHAAPIRERVCRNLTWLGLDLDAAANAARATCISAAGSKVSAWVVPTDEERMIATHVTEVLGV